MPAEVTLVSALGRAMYTDASPSTAMATLSSLTAGTENTCAFPVAMFTRRSRSRSIR